MLVQLQPNYFCEFFLLLLLLLLLLLFVCCLLFVVCCLLLMSVFGKIIRINGKRQTTVRSIGEAPGKEGDKREVAEAEEEEGEEARRPRR